YHDENIRMMIGNYWLSVTALTDKYKAIDKPDSASYWLNWGEERIPCNVTGNNINSITHYAYNYASVGDDSSVVQLYQKAENELIEELNDHMSKFDEIQHQLMTAEAEQKAARENADIDKRQELKNTTQQTACQRQR